jgi:hypothetical protein
MYRKQYIIHAIVFSFALSCVGCDMFSEEIPPDQLPPIPEECISESYRYEEMLRAAYTSIEASQTQVSITASKFAECMQNAGLTKGETKGIIKDIERYVRQEVDQGGSAGELWPR